MTRILKIGGNQLDDPAFITGVGAIVKRMRDVPIIVHGGGKGIKALAQKLRVEPKYLDGRRVTDTATMEIIMMVLCGQANLALVAALTNAGVEAQGFNGIDRGLIRAQPVLRPNGSLGRVGEITRIRIDVLQDILAQNIVPVIAPVLLGEDGGFFNINADKAAGTIGAAIGAKEVIFLTDVSGVLKDGALVAHVNQEQGQQMIASGLVTGGMAVKLTAALDALLGGAQTAMITNLEGLEKGTGTTISIQ